ncbi:tRNA (adenosine(37)-N6)-threonylcarbamoyltransferase complex dimerization subunit type 1 TsaB [Leptolyngbya sp. AN02str]|uniref:tRNA (adenosine(37)-N6)-threonylcarbamoyltransferase complex dimerization subunit type 1 TsaB n=1 Tax=Leptolyngbya sp. AN02str TaxID=3423363 RepID=UPI003D31ED62
MLPNQYALAIHTSSPDLGLALSNFDQVSRCQTWELGQELSTHLQLYMAEFLQPQAWSDLAFMAVAKGPGGFTGTRIGVVAARTLAQQLDIPLYAVSTLAAIAHRTYQQHFPNGNAPHLAVEMPAQREQLHVGIYAMQDGRLQPQLDDTVMHPIQWQATLVDWHQPVCLTKAERNLGSTAMDMLQLAYAEWQHQHYPTWAEAIPHYGQHPVEN